MNFVRAFTAFLLISHLAFAEACPNAVRLKVGDVVRDCERIGLSLPEELEIRKTVKGAETDQKFIAGQTQLLSLKDLLIDTQGKELIVYKDGMKAARTDADGLRSRQQTTLLLGVGIGVVGTFLAAWAWSLAARR